MHRSRYRAFGPCPRRSWRNTGAVGISGVGALQSFVSRPAMKTLDWYFDFISPYAYLQNAVLGRVAARAVVRRRPILFAALLNHWGQLGPAEIPNKRTWTYRHCVWLAARHGIPLAMPAMHPFNSLPLLRLSVALGSTPEVVDRLFAFVWVDGKVPSDDVAWQALLAELGVDEAAIRAPAVKDALRVTGDDAVAAGVFGVPTAVVDGETFWGFDATDMLLAYLAGDAVLASDAMRAAVTLPLGVTRPQAARVR
jgi:2-hydroxychromene-2-carboxylate isomerase